MVGWRSVVAALCFAPAVAFAQPTPPSGTPEQQQGYRAAFAAMMADPPNLDKTFAFASAAIAVGDFEGAIGALERMLIINPNLPRVRLELGVLYYRLGSFEVARTYISAALQAKDMPPEVRERAERVLAEIDRRLNPSKFSGTVMGGVRFQTNANASPSRGEVRVGGIDAVLTDQFRATSDFNVFLGANLVHLYDLGTQSGDAIDTRAALYGSRQFRRIDVDLLYLALSTGPRLAVAPDSIEGLSLRPNVGVELVALGGYREYVSLGGGLSVDKLIEKGLISASVDWRRRLYHDSTARPSNSLRDGNEITLRVGIDREIVPWLAASASFGYTRFLAPQGFNAYGEWSVSAGLIATYDLFGFVPNRATVLSLNAAYLLADYNAPDGTIDPATTRQDREWRFSATLNVPVIDDIALVGQVGASLRNSSLPNYRYTNVYTMLGVALRF